MKHFKLFCLAVLAGGLLTFVLHSFELHLFEAGFYDFRMRYPFKKKDATHAVLVKIDERTLDKLNEFSPLSLKYHTSLLRIIGKSNPKAIAYFVDFSESSTNVEEATTFVSTTQELLQNNNIPVWIGTDVDITGEVVPPYPLSKIPHKVALIHKDGTAFAEDKVTRRALFSIYGEPVLHVELSKLFTNKSKSEEYRGIYEIPEIHANYFFINYVGPTQEHQHPFPEISAIDILDGKVSPDFFKDKLVLIGTLTKEDSSDYVYTPYSRNVFTNSKLTVHANILETLIHDSAIQKISKKFELIFTFFLTALIIGIVFRTSPAKGVLVTILSALIVVIVTTLTFHTANIWLPLAYPLLGVFFAYYLFVPYRLIMEYKKRWKFQKKNEILTQVEELKSNFMSLITHDLKTPVARIQGMAEILVRSGADSKIVSEILGSTEELNRFITSILELAQIESNRIQLTKHGKDINKIIEDCVQKFHFQARAKHMSISTNLEPLFPILVDSGMITKVISNLIDNAIKYSPAETKVEIESKEALDSNFIQIKVKDAGYGISQKDQESLFSKFFRAKNDFTLKTKGTGLGLYLSRYFIELHNGSLNIESVEGRGSTFIILLPIEDKVLPRVKLTPTKHPQITERKQGGKAYV